MIIETINSPADLKPLKTEQLNLLCQEIRNALITKMSKTGGHMASNLGVVEITVALHYVFNSPLDKIVFDVSHQSYTHKILTGRKNAFLFESSYDEVSGYTNPKESEHDLFNIGHTSTSISLACGLAKSRDLNGGSENIVAVIGDASLDGGEAFEALNYSKELNSGLIVVVNDNNMSIPENYGALHQQLNELKQNNGCVKNNYFEALGLKYIFVKDGHNIEELIKTFKSVKDTKHPVVVHCCTQKGKGYIYSENNKEKWHWAQPFNIETGEYLGGVPKENYGSLVANHLLEKMKHDPNVIVVAASTPLCIGFNSENRIKAGKQYMDVGIAEQNAISIAAGLARGGSKPVFATNSTFYQRAYDQIEQEMCISKCPATMIVSHASVWGHTNDTHVGLYDIALFSNVPNLIYLAPTNWEEYKSMLDWSIEQTDNPVMIRIPWTRVNHSDFLPESDYSNTKYSITKQGSGVAIIALGSFYQLGEKVCELLSGNGFNPTLVNPRFITGIDADTLDNIQKKHELVVTLEDGVLVGGFGSKIAQYYGLSNTKVMNKGFSLNIPSRFKSNDLLEENRLQPEQIVDDILKVWRTRE